MIKMEWKGLNPCFNGRYSQSHGDFLTMKQTLVLILVLMEDTLRDEDFQDWILDALVLILVLMEDTLRGGYAVAVKATQNSLNPCFNGRYSQRF